MDTLQRDRLTPLEAILKRALDISVASIGLVLTSWLIALAFLLATLDTGCLGFFPQTRVGRYGRPFKLLKIRTMRPTSLLDTTVTTATDERITPFGRWLRKYKIDELPQLFNVLVGQMSLVGPRPDVPGFADRLTGDDRVILNVRPGITGPATLEYRNEEYILSRVSDPEEYNAQVIFPEKVRLNREYIQNYSFLTDLHCIWRTLVSHTARTEDS